MKIKTESPAHEVRGAADKVVHCEETLMPQVAMPGLRLRPDSPLY